MVLSLLKYCRDYWLDKAKGIKGRKRHTAVDTFGLVLRVVVTAASVPEREASKQVVQAVYQMGQRVSRLFMVRRLA